MTRTGVLLTLIALGILGSSPLAAAQEKGDKAIMAKVVAEKFAKQFILEKNLVEATKMTTVPFLEIEQGRERKPKRIEKSTDLEKRLRKVAKHHDEIGIRANTAIAKVYDAPAAVELGESAKGVFNPETDRFIAVDFTQDGGFPFGLLVLVGWREDQPKVIGYGLYFAR